MDCHQAERVCRICLEDDGVLIVPCKCRGSMQYVHRACLDEWRGKSVNAAAITHCMTCKTPYQTTKQCSRFDVAKSVSGYAIPKMLCFCVLAIATSFLQSLFHHILFDQDCVGDTIWLAGDITYSNNMTELKGSVGHVCENVGEQVAVQWEVSKIRTTLHPSWLFPEKDRAMILESMRRNLLDWRLAESWQQLALLHTGRLIPPIHTPAFASDRDELLEQLLQKHTSVLQEHETTKKRIADLEHRVEFLQGLPQPLYPAQGLRDSSSLWAKLKYWRHFMFACFKTLAYYCFMAVRFGLQSILAVRTCEGILSIADESSNFSLDGDVKRRVLQQYVVMDLAELDDIV